MDRLQNKKLSLWTASAIQSAPCCRMQIGPQSATTKTMSGRVSYQPLAPKTVSGKVFRCNGPWPSKCPGPPTVLLGPIVLRGHCAQRCFERPFVSRKAIFPIAPKGSLATPKMCPPHFMEMPRFVAPLGPLVGPCMSARGVPKAVYAC